MIKKYFIITDPNFENSNPGDIFIGKGIEYLIREAERLKGYSVIINYINLFSINEDVWRRVFIEADYLILAGTPNFNKDGVSPHIEKLLPLIKAAHSQLRKIRTAALWVGSGFTNMDYTREQAIERLYKPSEEVIKEYGQIFDKIIVRDDITKELFSKAGINVEQLCDSVFFAADYYDIQRKEPEYNIITLRDMPGKEKEVISLLKKLESQLDIAFPTLYIAHSTTDFIKYQWHFGPHKVIGINNPPDLLEMYSRANQVVSMRIHGTVPSVNFGKPVMNISNDSRDAILKYFDASTYSLNTVLKDGTLRLKKCEGIEEMKDKDKFRFYKLWEDKI